MSQKPLDSFARALVENSADEVPDAAAKARNRAAMMGAMTGASVVAGLTKVSHSSFASAVKSLGVTKAFVAKTAISLFVASAVSYGVYSKRAAVSETVKRVEVTRVVAEKKTEVAALEVATPEVPHVEETKPRIVKRPLAAPVEHDAKVEEQTSATAPTAGEEKPLASIRAQLNLIDYARRALNDGLPNEAIEFVDTYRSEFSQGQFLADARILKVRALVKLGRREEAQDEIRQSENHNEIEPLNRILSEEAKKVIAK